MGFYGRLGIMWEFCLLKLKCFFSVVVAVLLAKLAKRGSQYFIITMKLITVKRITVYLV